MEASKRPASTYLTINSLAVITTFVQKRLLAIVQVASKNAIKRHSKEEAEEWRRSSTLLSGSFRKKQGLDIGACKLLLHVRPCEGLMRRLDGTVEKRFSEASIIHPVQVPLRRPTAFSTQLSWLSENVCQ